MIEHPSLILATLVLTGTISEKEADLLTAELAGKDIPLNWKDVVAQFEGILGRRIEPKQT